MYEQTTDQINYWKIATAALIAALLIAVTLWYFNPAEVVGIGATIAIGIVSMIIFFVPSALAIKRKHPQIGPILLINLFCGMSIIGWFIALVWSCSAISNDTARRS